MHREVIADGAAKAVRRQAACGFGPGAELATVVGQQGVRQQGRARAGREPGDVASWRHAGVVVRWR